VDTARTLVELFRVDREQITTLGRGAGSALRVHHELQRRPLGDIPGLCSATALTPPTVAKALAGLQRLRIVREITGRRRDRVFAYDRYLALLSEGT
jgi:Fic family protein